VAKGGRWCFPGGHVEPGETSRKAIQRELAEELGLVVRPVERLGAVQVVDAGYVLAVWRVDVIAGAMCPAPAEVSDVRWVRREEIGRIHPGLASNERVAEMLSRLQDTDV